MTLLSQASNLNMFLIVAFIYGIGFRATQSSLQTMAVNDVSPSRLGAANATFFTAFDCGVGLGAVILGIISSNVGYAEMYLWASASAVIVFILYFITGRKGKLQDENDNHIYRLYLTENGREIIPKINSAFLELVTIFSTNLSKSEEEQTIIVLKRILYTLSEEKNKINSNID